MHYSTTLRPGQFQHKLILIFPKSDTCHFVIDSRGYGPLKILYGNSISISH